MDKNEQFGKIAAEFWRNKAENTDLDRYSRGFYLDQAKKWENGTYQFKCLNCSGSALKEDCCCCSYANEGSVDECNEILSWKQEQIAEETQYLQTLLI